MNRTEIHPSAIAVLVTIILLGAATGATSVNAQSVDGEIAVSPTDVSLEQGESRTITITYERLSNATPQGIEYTLRYDPNVISVTNQEQGSYLGGRALVNNISTPGKVEYVEAIFDGEGVEKSSGPIATITIEPASDVEDGETTELEFTTAKASDAGTAFTITTTGGTVETIVSEGTNGSTNEETDEESSTSDRSAAEGSSTNGEPQDSNTNTSETNSSATGNVNESTPLSNKTEDANPNEPANTGQTNDSSTSDDSEPEDGTDESVPGFGITATVLSVVSISYMASKKLHE